MLVDGQQRQSVALALGKGAELVRCLVIESFGDEKLEALLFEKLNFQANVKASAINKSELSRGEKHTVARETILRRFGLTTRTGEKGTVKSIVAIKTIYNKGAVLLTQTVRVIINSFGMEGDSLQQNIFNGVSKFLERYRDEKSFDEDQFVTRLRKYGSAAELLHKADALLEVSMEHSKKAAVMSLLRQIYNKGRSKHKLPV